MPLVFQSHDWDHGTFFGAVMRSFATSASDQVGLVNDPMAMKPFIGYNVKVGGRCVLGAS
jgi:phosphoenolpyruvate carboxykinase (GTP)